MLELRNVRVVYPNGFEALKSVDLTVQPGEIVALIGRSGAGKSTLLRCVNGLQTISDGCIAVDGVEVNLMDRRQLASLRRSIGFVWQEYNVVERLTALQNVLSGRLGHEQSLASLLGFWSRADREIAVRSLERVNLLHRAQQRADRLSGGEKQRVAIARALAQQPRVLLADEPVASLDQELAWQVMSDLVRVARDEQVPTLITIHSVELAREFADRVVGIAQGLVVCDTPAPYLNDEMLDRVYRFDRQGSPRPLADERRLVGVGA